MLTAIIVGAVLGILLGPLVGKSAVRRFEKKYNQKLLEDAKAVVRGEKENKIEIEGKTRDVNTFIFKGEDDKKYRLTFGKLINNGN